MAKTQPTDAVALLKADHRKVEGLFASYEAARSESKKRPRRRKSGIRVRA